MSLSVLGSVLGINLGLVPQVAFHNIGIVPLGFNFSPACDHGNRGDFRKVLTDCSKLLQGFSGQNCVLETIHEIKDLAGRLLIFKFSSKNYDWKASSDGQLSMGDNFQLFCAAPRGYGIFVSRGKITGKIRKNILVFGNFLYYLHNFTLISSHFAGILLIFPLLLLYF